MSTGKTRHGVKRENPGSTKPSPNKANVAPKTSTKKKGSARSKQINAKSNRHAPESKFLALSAVQSRERAKPDHLFETESADNTTSKRQKMNLGSSHNCDVPVDPTINERFSAENALDSGKEEEDDDDDEETTSTTDTEATPVEFKSWSKNGDRHLQQPTAEAAPINPSLLEHLQQPLEQEELNERDAKIALIEDLLGSIRGEPTCVDWKKFLPPRFSAENALDSGKEEEDDDDDEETTSTTDTEATPVEFKSWSKNGDRHLQQPTAEAAPINPSLLEHLQQPLEQEELNERDAKIALIEDLLGSIRGEPTCVDWKKFLPPHSVISFPK